MERLILRQQIGRLLLIGINRPQLGNKLNKITAAILHTVLQEEFEVNDGISAAVIYGEGGTFCEGWETSTDNSPILPKKQGMFVFKKPTFAAISGNAFGVGFDLMTACDFRIAEPNSTISPSSNVGLPMVDGIAERLSFLIGGSNAIDIILTQPTLTAIQGHAMGLVNRVTKSGTALGTAVHMADNLLRHRNSEALLQNRQHIFCLHEKT